MASVSRVGRARSVPVVLGAGRMLPDFEAGLQGDSSAVETEDHRRNVSRELRCGRTGRQDRAVRHHGSQGRRAEARLNSMTSSASPLAWTKAVSNSCAGSRRQHATRTGGCHPRTREEAGAGRAACCESAGVAPSRWSIRRRRELQIDAGRRMGAKDASQLPAGRKASSSAARRRVALSLLINEAIKTAAIKVDQAKVRGAVRRAGSAVPGSR